MLCKHQPAVAPLKCSASEKNNMSDRKGTLQGINISHLGKRKIIFKYAILGAYVSFLEGNMYQKGYQN